MDHPDIIHAMRTGYPRYTCRYCGGYTLKGICEDCRGEPPYAFVEPDFDEERLMMDASHSLGQYVESST